MEPWAHIPAVSYPSNLHRKQSHFQKMPDNTRCLDKTQPTPPHAAKSINPGTQSPGSCISLLLQQLEVAQEPPSSWQQTWAPNSSSTGNLLGFWGCSPALSRGERCCLLHMYWMFPGRNKTKLNNSRELKMAGEARVHGRHTTHSYHHLPAIVMCLSPWKTHQKGKSVSTLL